MAESRDAHSPNARYIPNIVAKKSAMSGVDSFSLNGMVARLSVNYLRYRGAFKILQ